MRTYKHWLLINNMDRDEIVTKQWNNLKEYLNSFPKSKITVYNKICGSIFHKVICLECTQEYNSLELDCNSFFDGSLKRLERKPAYLEETFNFEVAYDIYSLRRYEKIH